MKLNHVYEIIWADICEHGDLKDFSGHAMKTASYGVIMKEDKEAIYLVNFITEDGERDYIWIPKSVITKTRCLGKAKIKETN